jgi:hypothetical protein
MAKNFILERFALVTVQLSDILQNVLVLVALLPWLCTSVGFSAQGFCQSVQLKLLINVPSLIFGDTAHLIVILQLTVSDVIDELV